MISCDYLDVKLKELNLTNIQYNSVIGTIVSKITKPGSELATYDWLCNKSGLNELLECDYNKISSNSIYRASDILLKHKEELENHLYKKTKQLFNYDETITLYDLTNTYSHFRPNSRIQRLENGANTRLSGAGATSSFKPLQRSSSTIF